MCIPVFAPALTESAKTYTSPVYFLSVIPKAQRWHEAERIDRTAVGQAQVVPTDIYKVPLLPLGMEPQSWAPLGDSDMEESPICVCVLITHTHTQCKSHLQSYWVMAIFCCPGAFHTPDHRTQSFQQLSAPCSYLSTHPGASHRGSAPSSTEAGTYSTYSLTSLYFTFIWLSSPLDFFSILISSLPSFSHLCLSFSSLSDHVHSNPDQF